MEPYSIWYKKKMPRQRLDFPLYIQISVITYPINVRRRKYSLGER
ncbi:hypothetical protein AC70_4180 [Escherichia coli 2-210-07_S4_C1]|nr:hypothetical protein AC70_4180 [Escherichia coli 2-210-07_S4_C1]